MPTFMLKKVAIAQGFRLAFPDDLGGMPYIPEELPNDKGGNTVSETLPKGEVKEDEVIDAQEDTPDFEPFLTEEEQAGNEAPSEPLAVGTELRTKVDGLIAEAGIDTKELKVWLFGAKKIKTKFGHPSLSSMSVDEANKMVEKWPEVVKKFNLWIDKQNQKAA